MPTVTLPRLVGSGGLARLVLGEDALRTPGDDGYVLADYPDSIVHAVVVDGNLIAVLPVVPSLSVLNDLTVNYSYNVTVPAPSSSSSLVYDLASSYVVSVPTLTGDSSSHVPSASVGGVVTELPWLTGQSAVHTLYVGTYSSMVLAPLFGGPSEVHVVEAEPGAVVSNLPLIVESSALATPNVSVGPVDVSLTVITEGSAVYGIAVTDVVVSVPTIANYSVLHLLLRRAYFVPNYVVHGRHSSTVVAHDDLANGNMFEGPTTIVVRFRKEEDKVV